MPIGAISRLPQLLGSSCGALGSGGGAQLAKTMVAGLSVAIEREAVEARLGALPYSRGRLEHAYTSVAAGEAVLQWSGILSNADTAALISTAVEMEAHGARLTLAAISKGLRSGLGILERFERLNVSRLEASTAATDDPARLAALRSEPAGLANLVQRPLLELVADENQTSPCIYLAQVGDGGFKIGDASNGVRARYPAESGVTAIPILLTQRSLAGSQSGGKPDLEGTRSFAREAIETLAAVAIGGGLGKAAAIYGSVATLGAKPGLVSTSFKPGMEGATPAQLAATLKPGMVGATPAQQAATFKPGMAGATPAQLAAQLAALLKPGLVGATAAQRKHVEVFIAASANSLAHKRALLVEAGHGAQVEANKRKRAKRKEKDAGRANDLVCNRCDIMYKSLDALRLHERKAHPYCVPGCIRNRRDDGSLMIGCDACDCWYHPDCLARPPVDAEDDEDTPWVCPPCVLAGGEDDVDDD